MSDENEFDELSFSEYARANRLKQSNGLLAAKLGTNLSGLTATVISMKRGHNVRFTSHKPLNPVGYVAHGLNAALLTYNAVRTITEVASRYKDGDLLDPHAYGLLHADTKTLIGGFTNCVFHILVSSSELVRDKPLIGKRRYSTYSRTMAGVSTVLNIAMTTQLAFELLDRREEWLPEALAAIDDVRSVTAEEMDLMRERVGNVIRRVPGLNS